MKLQSIKSKTPHPCAGMSPAQRRDFELVCVGERPQGGYRTIDALERRGLIVKGEPKIVGRDSFGLIRVPSYFVPPSIHAQWCKWCGEQS